MSDSAEHRRPTCDLKHPIGTTIANEAPQAESVCTDNSFYELGRQLCRIASHVTVHPLRPVSVKLDNIKILPDLSLCIC